MRLTMTSLQLYSYVYKKLNTVTPIKADCGKLCGAACCKGDSDTGMYLFPNEAVMLGSTDHKIKDVSGRKLFVCDGTCDRNFRPLSCRIFPLIPYVDSEGRLSVIFDQRAKGICPIAHANDFSNLDPEFIKNVTHISKLLIRFRDIKKFIYELSKECDEYKDYFTL